MAAGKGKKRPRKQQDVEEQQPRNLMNRNLVDKAVGSLLKLVAEGGAGSIKEFITVQVALRKEQESAGMRPFLIQIPHPLVPKTACAMCLIVADGWKAKVEAQLAATPVTGLTKVVTLVELRKQYMEMKGRYDLFLCDNSIMATVRKTLSKLVTGSAKRQMANIKLKPLESLAGAVRIARDNTYLRRSKGGCWSMKIATTATKHEHIVDNIMQGGALAVSHIPGGWKNVKNLYIKTTDSPSLPVYLKATEAMDLRARELQLGATSNSEVADSSAARRDSVPPEQRRIKSASLRAKLLALAAETAGGGDQGEGAASARGAKRCKK